MKTKYSSLLEAVNDLQARGFNTDIETVWTEIKDPSKFRITDTYRFEGASNPDDNSIVYEIEIEDGRKGILIDGYGTTSGEIMKIIKQIPIQRRASQS